VASRAEASAGRPSIPAALRAAAPDFFYNSWRLVPANVVWGAMLLLVGLVAMTAPVFGLLLVPLLALPTVGLFRIAALIVRGESVSLADGFAAWRSVGLVALVTGIVITVAIVVAAWDIAAGFTSDSVLGWALGTAAAWGLLVVLAVSIAFWPLIVDPGREGRPMRERLRLAGLIVVAYPARILALVLVVAALLVASVVAFAALITISIAYVALVTCRWVLPASDRLEVRLAARRSAAADPT
jgi:hypothetical protein